MLEWGPLDPVAGIPIRERGDTDMPRGKMVAETG